MKPVLTVSAMLEIGAGLILLAAPGTAISLTFGLAGDGASVFVGRVLGAALLSIGAACWLARPDRGSAASRALVIGLVLYNTAIVALVISSLLGSPGPTLWMIAALHGAMSIWCVSSLRLAAVPLH